MGRDPDRRQLDESFRPYDGGSHASAGSLRPTGSRATDVIPGGVDVGGGSIVQTPAPEKGAEHEHSATDHPAANPEG